MQNKNFIRIPHLQKQSVDDTCHFEYFKYVIPQFAEGTFPQSVSPFVKENATFLKVS